MRNFTLLLIVFNLAYLIWNVGSFAKESADGESGLREANKELGQSLLLLSELNTESLVLVGKASEETDGELMEEVLGEVTDAIDRVGDDDKELVVEVSEEFVAENEEELLGEPLVEAGSQGVTVSQDQIGLDQNESQCLSLAVLASDEFSESLVLELADLGYNPEVNIVEVKANPDFWVHMPPFSTMGAARQRLVDLQLKNIDSYIITEAEGELAQGISLGLFGEMDRALVLQSQVAAEGYSSEIYEVERSDSEIWVKITGLTALEIDGVRGLESINSQSELKLEEKLCETIAPED